MIVDSQDSQTSVELLSSYLQDQQCIYHLIFIILTDLLSPVFLIMSLIRVGGSNHASNTPFYVSAHRALSIRPGFIKKPIVTVILVIYD